MATPRDEAELIILRTFRSVLRVPDADITSSFFDLAGNSLQSIVMANRLSRHLATPVTPAMIYKAATPERLAAAVRQGAPGRMSAIVPLHDPDGTPEDPHPIVITPGIAGDAAFAHGVVHGASHREVYGLQTTARPGPPPDPNWTFQSLAALYCEQLLAELPGRPLVVAGHSLGGCVALQIGLRLSEVRGHPGCQVVLVAPPHYDKEDPWTMRAVLEEMLYFASSADLSSEDAQARAAELAAGRTPAQLIGIVRDGYVRNGWLPADAADAMVVWKAEQRLANLQAFERYRPGRELAQTALLILSWDEADDPIAGTPLAAALPKWQSVRVDGPHPGLFDEPWVRQVGVELARAG